MRFSALFVAFVVACGGTDAGGLDIQIDSGVVHGKQVGAVRKFFGIPYAAPPVGVNRWKSPQPVAPWSTPLDTLSTANVCPQVNPFGAGGGDEDCLYLNVFTPATVSDAPVMFWLHGGAFAFGSGSEVYYDGAKLADKFGVVVVTINYRLGAFGSFSHPDLPADASGNFGIEDQLAALQWVQRNIAAFGGDPAKVTLFGESAGGFSACLHYLSPNTHGLFRYVISESGLCTAGYERTKAQAIADSMTIAAKLGCTTNVESCLRSKTTDELTAAVTPLPVAMQPPGGPLYLPSVISPSPFIDGVVLASDMRSAFATGGFEHRPLILGTNHDEGTLFHSVILANPVTDDTQYRAALGRHFGTANVDAIVAHYPVSSFASANAALAAVTGDAQFVCPARRAARGAVAAGSPVYRYTFDRGFENPLITDGGVVHSGEIPFVFGNDNFLLGQMGPTGLPVSEAVQGYWTRFAETGDPNGAGAVTWPRADGDQHLVIDLTTAPGSGLKTALCDFWDSI
ncbi:MAG: putative carboxylesterase [Myxococcales bacterium]|nr:putative carboxylesterase [Myxococcales bacterium]